MFLRVRDLVAHNEIPKVIPDAEYKKVYYRNFRKTLGVHAVTVNNKIIGIITDGDLRRMLARNRRLLTTICERYYESKTQNRLQ